MSVRDLLSRIDDFACSRHGNEVVCVSSPRLGCVAVVYGFRDDRYGDSAIEELLLRIDEALKYARSRRALEGVAKAALGELEAREYGIESYVGDLGACTRDLFCSCGMWRHLFEDVIDEMVSAVLKELGEVVREDGYAVWVLPTTTSDDRRAHVLIEGEGGDRALGIVRRVMRPLSPLRRREEVERNLARVRELARCLARLASELGAKKALLLAKLVSEETDPVEALRELVERGVTWWKRGKETKIVVDVPELGPVLLELNRGRCIDVRVLGDEDWVEPYSPEEAFARALAELVDRESELPPELTDLVNRVLEQALESAQ